MTKDKDGVSRDLGSAARDGPCTCPALQELYRKFRAAKMAEEKSDTLLRHVAQNVDLEDADAEYRPLLLIVRRAHLVFVETVRQYHEALLELAEAGDVKLVEQGTSEDDSGTEASVTEFTHNEPGARGAVHCRRCNYLIDTITLSLAPEFSGEPEPCPFCHEPLPHLLAERCPHCDGNLRVNMGKVVARVGLWNSLPKEIKLIVREMCDELEITDDQQ